jgi:hypothetical protein
MLLYFKTLANMFNIENEKKTEEKAKTFENG